MGADGGSIPKRCELVRQAKQSPNLFKNSRFDKWRQCALSQATLAEPIVADRLGRLYNKDAIIQALLKRKLDDKMSLDGEKEPNDITYRAESQVDPIAHIHSLKELIQLRLLVNPTKADYKASTAMAGLDNYHLDGTPTALFICPLTRKEMNGSIPFLFHPDCGCTLSETALKTISKVSLDLNDTNLESVCPSCDAKIHGPWIPINGTPEQQKVLHDFFDKYKNEKKERPKKKHRAV
jgi:Rtf2 RING-finger